jgi:hypothetical protein
MNSFRSFGSEPSSTEADQTINANEDDQVYPDLNSMINDYEGYMFSHMKFEDIKFESAALTKYDY